MNALVRLTVLASTVFSAACASGASNSSVNPVTATPAMRGASDAVKTGIYAVIPGHSVGAVYGFSAHNRANNPPICTVRGTAAAFSIGVDQMGNLVVGAGVAPYSVTVFKGPKMCGSRVGSFTDPYGQPGDVATNDAVHGTIAVANIFDSGDSAGSLSICTLANGCTVNLTNPNFVSAYGVAIDSRGNCWISGSTGSSATLTYFKGCAGAGRATTGYTNVSSGGLDIDSRGDLASLSFSNGSLYVYSGCNPACKEIAGPIALHGDSETGRFNENSTEFVAADFQYGEYDVYRYDSAEPGSLKFKYSFNRDVTGSTTPGSVALNPPSKR